MKDYVGEGNFLLNRPELWNQVQCVLACDQLGPSRRMQVSFVLVAVNGEDTSVLWLATALRLFCLNFQMDCNGTEYVFQQYVECTLELDEVAEGIDCVGLS